MRKKYFLFSFVILFVLSGCSLISDVTNTVDYIDEASEYINSMSTFANDAQNLLNQASQSPEGAKELLNRLIQLRQEMEEFNQLTPPDSVRDIHQQVVDANNEMINAINAYEKGVQNGTVNMASFTQNDELIQAIQNINNSLQQLQDLQKN